MACEAVLTDWAGLPYKFEGYPLYQDYIDYKNSGVFTRELTDGEDYVEFGDCSSLRYPIYLRWLNKKGGSDYWLFGAKHEYSVEINNGVQYRDVNDMQRWSTRGDVIPTVFVKSAIMTRSQKEVVKNVYRSIQVEQYVDNTWLPVLIREGTFLESVAGNSEYSISFVMELHRELIQTQ